MADIFKIRRYLPAPLKRRCCPLCRDEIRTPGAALCGRCLQAIRAFVADSAK